MSPNGKDRSKPKAPETKGQARLREKRKDRVARKKRLKELRKLKEEKRAARAAAIAAMDPSPSTKTEKEKQTPANMQTTPGDKEKQRRKVIDALERDVEELSRLSAPTGEQTEEIERVRAEIQELKMEFYRHLGPWQRLQLARHPQRPYTDDYIRILFEDFSEIHGDRNFSDDPALITGMAKFHGRHVMVIGSQKGRDIKQRLARNFGQAKPEGYRKALRAMKLAAKFGKPILVFVDTPGAYPGVDAEERGQAEAIARNLLEMSRLPVPIIVTITGEGGSGGALAVAVGDKVFMLENSVYSVISPEGCATIMWRDSTKAEVAAEALKITATDLQNLKLIDGIVPEPEGGAHFNHEATANALDPFLSLALDELTKLTARQLLDQRYAKFRRMGQFFS
ncbi:MAG: acetyl-CoA carboxylase carboxyltransferase subunit alpha [Candidatus Acidiferrales bacterium]